MNTKKVKNISDDAIAIVDIGIVFAGDVVEVPVDFNNANFVEVESKPKKDEAIIKEPKK